MRLGVIFQYAVVSILITLLLSSCGKSGGEQQKQEVENRSPSVSLPDELVVLEQTQGQPTLVKLAATVTNPSLQAITYKWSATRGDGIDTESFTGAEIEFYAPDVKRDTQFELSLTVTDTSGFSATDTIKILVQKVNNPPVIDKLDRLRVAELETFSVAAVISDPDDDTLDVEWSIVDDAGVSLTLLEPNALVLKAQVAEVSQNTIVELQVKATDGDGASTSSILDVEVLNDNEAPSGIALVSGTALSTGKVVLDWLQASDNVSDDQELRYRLHLNKGGRFTPSEQTVYAEVGERLTLEVDGLEAATKYYAQIEVVDKSGNKALSNQIPVSTLAKEPELNPNQPIHTVSSFSRIGSSLLLNMSEQETLPQVGDVIFSSEETGLFRLVSKVSVDGLIANVTTSAAAINRAYNELAVATNVRLLPLPDEDAAKATRNWRARGADSSMKPDKVATLKWLDSGLQLQQSKLAQVSDSNPSNRAQGIAASSQKQEVLEVRRDNNLQVSGPRHVLFRPEQQNELRLNANIVDDSGEFEVTSFEMVSVTHSLIDSATELNISSTNTEFAEDAGRLEKTLLWSPTLAHVDYDNNEPYLITFKATAAKPEQADDVVLFTVKVYVGTDIPAKTLATIGDDDPQDEVELSVDTEFNIEPNIDISADITAGVLTMARATFSAFADVDTTIRLKAEQSGSAKSSETLVDRSFIRLATGGEVPIVVHGRFKLTAEITGQAEGRVDLAHELSSGLKLEAGFHYEDGQWQPISSVLPTMSFSISGQSNGQAYGDIKLIPSLEISFYDQATGNILVEPLVYSESKMEGDVDTSFASRAETGSSNIRVKTLTAGVQAVTKVNADLSVLDASVKPWPSSNLDELVSVQAFEKTILAGTPQISLTAKIPEGVSNSCLLALEAQVHPILLPASDQTLFDWVPDTANWSGVVVAGEEVAPLPSGQQFSALAKFTALDQYRVRFAGNSELGSWATQYEDLTLDFSDGNNDGLADYWASRFALDSSGGDADGDGLSNAEEFLACTMPNVSDSDGDGMLDGDEVRYGLEPHLDDAQDDLDGDGRSNIQEITEGTAVDLANQAPSVEVQIVEFDEVDARLTLRANARDTDGTVVQYLWAETSNHGVELATNNTAQIEIGLPDVASETVFRFNVTVTDNEGASTTNDSDISVTVIERINTPPRVVIAEIGAVFEGQLVELNGSSTSDLEDDLALAYLWQQTDETGIQLPLLGSDTARASWIAPAISEATSFQFELAATDSEGLTSSETIVVQVQPLPNDIERGVLVYYPFDGQAQDTSGNGRHAETSGDTSYELGAKANAITLDGAEQSLSLTDTSGFSEYAATLAFWLKMSDMPSINTSILQKDQDIQLQMTSSGRLVVQLWNAQQNAYMDIYTLASEQATGQWEFYTIGLNNLAKTGDIYVNGRRIDSFSIPEVVASLNRTNSSLIMGGGDDNTTVSLDEFRVYERVIEGDEVAMLYNLRTNYAGYSWSSRYENSEQLISNSGVQIGGSGYREGGHSCTEQSLDLSQQQVQFSWLIGDDSLAVYGFHLLDAASDWSQPILSVGPFSSDHAFEGTNLVETNQTYYTQIELRDEQTALVTTSTNGYGNDTSHIVQQRVVALSQDGFDATALTFCFGLWDNYAGVESTVMLTDIQLIEPTQWPVEVDPDAPAIKLEDLAGRILVIRGSNADEDWIWALKLVHETSDSTETVSYYGSKSQLAQSTFSWQQEVAHWQINGNALTLTRNDNEYELIFEDGQINAGENIADAMGDNAIISNFYLPTTVATTGIAGHKFVFLGAPNNRIYHFSTEDSVLVYEEGSEQQQSLSWILAENDTEIRFTDDDGQEFGFGNYSEFYSFMPVYGDNLATGKLLLDIVGNPIVDDVFADLEFEDAQFASCIQRLAQYYNWQDVTDVLKINCSSNSITSAQGIAQFPALQELNLSHNRLSSIDLGDNPELRILNLADNQLTTINLDSNTQLHTATLVNNPFDQDTLDYLLGIDWIENLLFGDGAAAPVITSRLNDTGITTCANVDTNGLACPVGEFRGQDGEFGRDDYAGDELLEKVGGGRAGFDFTKLDDNGKELAASALNWSCVRDNVTGLIWEVKTTDGGIRDTGNTYTWYNSTGINDGGLAGTDNGGSCTDTDKCDTEKFVDSVNTEGLCGAMDWRLPEKEELRSLVDYGSYLPAIDTDYFPNTQPAIYWSITPVSSNYILAWNTYFNYGDVYYSFKSGASFVRLVRGGK